MDKAKITFKNGTVIEAEVNGNCFIVDEKPDFPGDFNGVVIEGTDFDGKIDYARLVESASVDGRYWFAIVEIPETEREAKQVRADIDFIAMETGVEL